MTSYTSSLNEIETNIIEEINHALKSAELDYFEENLIQDLKSSVSKFFRGLNYGVADRAIDETYGSKDKLIQKIENSPEFKEEVKKMKLIQERMNNGEKINKKKILEEKQQIIDRKVKKEIDKIADTKNKKEFVRELNGVFWDGIIGGIINAILNGIIAVFTEWGNPGAILQKMIMGGIMGFYLNIVHRLNLIIYYNIKKVIKKDPYAEIGFWESQIIVFFGLSILAATLSAFFTFNIVAFLAINFILNIVLGGIIWFISGMPKYIPVFESQPSYKKTVKKITKD